MKKQCTVIYLGSEQIIALNGYGIQNHIVSLYYPGAARNAAKNTDGFILYDADSSVLKDCSGYRHRYDILEDNPNAIYYTDLEDMVQIKKWNHSESAQEDEPITNEELTACVADLMYETSLMQLGMEV